MPDVAVGRLGRRRIPVSGDDSVGGVDVGHLPIREVAGVVIADQTEAR